ncbi:twin-arginine translocase subunit TatB [Nitriliruptoraceae bacterium ZYF776]|nr:twin-arginine translocase subunit TatB [Profundirhabdus halotolerans]
MPGAQELLVIAVVAVVFFGPDRLPEIARNVGRFVRRVRALTSESVDELKRAAEAEGLDREWRELSDELRGSRDDLRGVRQDVDRSLRGGTGLPAPTPRSPVRGDDDPPPVDVEAT